MSANPEKSAPWPHAPTHRLGSEGVYFVTAATYQKDHHFRGRARLEVLHRGLLKVCTLFEWRLEAWAVFSNHYHFVAHSPGNAESLPFMLGHLHERMATWVNKLDTTPGRKVWHNYWETLLTHQTSYFARLCYTHKNAVHHGLVNVAADYPWCSAAWFEGNTSAATVKSIYRFETSRLTAPDDYAVDSNW